MHTTSTASNPSRALAAANEYASPLASPAKRIELANEIDLLVGRFVWDGQLQRHRMSCARSPWSRPGDPDRHVSEVK